MKDTRLARLQSAQFLRSTVYFWWFAGLFSDASNQGLEPAIFHGWNHVLDFGQHKGKLLNSVPKSYIEWVVKNKVYLGKPALQGALEQLNFIKSRTVSGIPKVITKRNVASRSNVNSNTPQRFIPSSDQLCVYVLQLQHNKWYVGITENMERRKIEHSSGKGSTWTRLHPVIQVHEVIRVTEDSKVGAESMLVAELMWRHGVNNVRGAEHCNTWPFDRRDTDRLVHYLGHHLELDYGEVRESLERQLDPQTSESRRPKRRSSSPERQSPPPTSPCFRCGRNSHWASDCFANFHVDGTVLDGDNEYSDLFGEIRMVPERNRNSRSTQRRRGTQPALMRAPRADDCRGGFPIALRCSA
jgi:uncharacterized protein (DUF3820 family)